MCYLVVTTLVQTYYSLHAHLSMPLLFLVVSHPTLIFLSFTLHTRVFFLSLPLSTPNLLQCLFVFFNQGTVEFSRSPRMSHPNLGLE
jgi:hypothetical protein